ncbi:MAG: hypothetical protein OJF49_003821 [Ktedonobacterales bacterium]|nr:MAG: hypothetical protein OJF49_003821 [Ktedonobacterales bacterium]
MAPLCPIEVERRLSFSHAKSAESATQMCGENGEKCTTKKSAKSATGGADIPVCPRPPASATSATGTACQERKSAISASSRHPLCEIGRIGNSGQPAGTGITHGLQAGSLLYHPSSPFSLTKKSAKSATPICGHFGNW